MTLARNRVETPADSTNTAPVVTKSLLLIEDNSADAAAIRRTLQKSAPAGRDYRLVLAEDAAQALDLLAREKYDCVLLDYRLPDMDGLELMRRLPHETKPPIIILTGFGTEAIAVEAMKAGAADYLAKSIDGRHLKLLPTVVERVLREARLNDEHRRLNRLQHLILNSAAEGIISVDCHDTIQFANPAAAALLGWPMDEFPHSALNERLQAYDYEGTPLPPFSRLCYSSHYDRTRTVWLQRQDGSRFAAQCTSAPIVDAETIFGGVLIFHDISAQLRLENELRLAASVMQNIDNGVMVTDPRGTIIAVNPAFSAITGYSAEESLGHTPRILKSDRHPAEFYQIIWRTIAHKRLWKGEMWNRRKGGELYLIHETITAIHDADGRISHYVALFSDITQLKEQEDRIRYQAHHDPLTDLPNRLLFDDRLEQALHRAQRNSHQVAVLFIDLDNFKYVNDTLGHEIGDHVLRMVADRLKESVRISDTVSRLGGDEFTILLDGVSSRDVAAEVAAKVVQLMAEPMVLDELTLHITTSIGISLYPDDGLEGRTLLSCADQAMYRAKAIGRNNFAFLDTQPPTAPELPH